MKIPLFLIKAYLPLELTPQQIGETLTLLGIEVDRIDQETPSSDPVFELSLTPNLGHAMSALGIARELSAALQLPLTSHSYSLPPKKLDKEITVSDFNLIPRYMCCLIEQIEVGPSPSWLKSVLEASGQKSINNVVDIANYIMIKTGQPLHAFDADLLQGHEIKVSPAKHPLKFLGLDGVEWEVPAQTLLIQDSEKPIALAGILGGANSAVSEKTTRILLEAASFNPISIRNASKKMGLRTESSHRFEKGIDPVGLETALAEAAQLLGGKIVSVADLKKGPFIPKVIPYRPFRINQLLGTKLSATEIEEIFTRLGFKVHQEKAEIPLYRNDLSEEIDLVEEVARIYGYNNIDKQQVSITSSQIPNDPVFLFENKMRRRLTGLGLFEFLTCDLISPKLAEISREITPAAMEFLKTTYSKSEEYSTLRTSLLPGLLQVAKGNFDQKNFHLAAFEIGRIHFQQKGKVFEIPTCAILLTGKAELPHWSRKRSDVDFFDLKGLIEPLAPKSVFVPSSHLSFHPGRQSDFKVGEQVIGSLGEIHPALLEKFDIAQRIYYAELNLLSLMQIQKHSLKVEPLPQYPASDRDATLPLDLKTPISAVLDLFHSPLLEKVELIDLYIPESATKKNVTFRFIYRDLFKTVSFEEVEREHEKVLSQVANLLAN